MHVLRGDTGEIKLLSFWKELLANQITIIKVVVTEQTKSQ